MPDMLVAHDTTNGCCRPLHGRFSASMRRRARGYCSAMAVTSSAEWTVQSADVVIVGGGIVGSAVAYFLSTDAAFQGRRIVLVERDPSYAEASTARSAGGLRQQFSTPENIALSQFTLALFRRLEAEFGPGADVGFREQGYLIMASPEARSVLAENVALQQSMRADIELLEAPELARRFPWIATEGVAAARLRPLGRGLVRSAEPRRAVSQCGQGARRRHHPRSRHRHRRARRPHRGGAAGKRRRHRLRRSRQRGGALGRRAGGAGGRAAAGGAAQALRLRHRLPRGLRRAASGAADRRSFGRVVPARGPLLPVRQVSRGERGAAGHRPRRTSTTPSSRARCGRGWRRACRRSRASRW